MIGTGIFLLALLGVAALAIFGSQESQEITDNSRPAPPTSDAYDTPTTKV